MADPARAQSERARAWRDERASLALVVVAWLLAVVAVNAVPYLPTHDGPQHIYLGHVINHFADPGSIYPSYYRPTQPLSALGFSLLFCPLDDLFGWVTAQRISLSIIVSVWGWGLWALARALAPERGMLGITGFAVAFQWALYMGFFSWMISLSLAFVTLSLAVRTTPWSRSRRSLIALLLCVHAMMHPFPALVTALVLLVLVLVHHPPRAWPRELALLALMGTPVALVVAYASGWLGGGSVSLPTRDLGVPPKTSWWEPLDLALRYFTGGPSWRSLPVVFAAATALALGCVGWFRGSSSRNDRALLVVGGALFALFLAAPLHLRHWELFSPRFLAPGTVFLLLVLPVERLSRRARRWALAGCALHAATALGWTTWFHRDLHARSSDLLPALAAPVHRTGPRFPVVLDTVAGYGDQLHAWYPYFEPLFNVGVLFAVEQGGVVPYTFTSIPQLHGLVMSDEGLAKMPTAPNRQLFGAYFRLARQRADAEEVLATLTNFASFGPQYQDVILYGDASDEQVFLERGYRMDAQRGKFSLLAFEGCPVRLAVPAAEPTPSAVTFEYGWYPVTKHSWKTVAPSGTVPIEGLVGLELRETPCGPVWFRVWADDNHSGDLDTGDRSCEGADPTGGFLQVLRRDTKQVTCSLRQPVL